MSVVGHMARVLFLATVCCTVAFADTQPTKLFVLLNRRGGIAADAHLMLANKSGNFPTRPVSRAASHPAEQDALLSYVPIEGSKTTETDFQLASPNNSTIHPHPRDKSLTARLTPDNKDVLLSLGTLEGNVPDIRFAPESKSRNLANPQLASLALNPMDHNQNRALSAEPFDMPATTARPGDITAKWTDLQSRILADERTLAACRSAAAHCPTPARRFLSIVDFGRQHHGRARIGWINRAVNLRIRPMSDWAQYGYADYWASPLETLRSEAGDCEDYAIVKYVALRNLGIAPSDLRIVIVQDNMRQAEHAVVAVRDDDKWLILDNRTMMILAADRDRRYKPLFVMDYRGARAYSTAAASR